MMPDFHASDLVSRAADVQSQSHHRGQLTTLMNQFGVDPGPTDFPAVPME